MVIDTEKNIFLNFTHITTLEDCFYNTQYKTIDFEKSFGDYQDNKEDKDCGNFDNFGKFVLEHFKRLDYMEVEGTSELFGSGRLEVILGQVKLPFSKKAQYWIKVVNPSFDRNKGKIKVFYFEVSSLLTPTLSYLGSTLEKGCLIGE